MAMESLKHFVRRSDDGTFYGPGTEPLLFAFFALIMLGTLLSLALLYLRRKRIARQRQFLPLHQGHTHRRSASVLNLPQVGRNERIFVYDEKMNLISNSSNSPPAEIPQIRVTFPDDEGEGHQRGGRVVVVHVTDTGSVGMSPLHDSAPPYQQADAERFQSLDLNRIGGLREKVTPQQQYS
jgi:hypothetical protein